MVMNYSLSVSLAVLAMTNLVPKKNDEKHKGESQTTFLSLHLGLMASKRIRFPPEKS